MNEKLDSLKDNHTWEICELAEGKKAIGCKWLYKTKYKANESIERYESRLVIMGNKQIYGVDYEERFAYVAKLASVRSILVVASLKD